jgi:hypothetical protein
VVVSTRSTTVSRPVPTATKLTVPPAADTPDPPCTAGTGPPDANALAESASLSPHPAISNTRFIENSLVDGRPYYVWDDGSVPESSGNGRYGPSA